VGCVGVGHQAAAMNPYRIRVHTDTAAVCADAVADAVAMIDRTGTTHTLDTGTDVATARGAQLGDDIWPAHVVLVDASGPAPAELDQLLALVGQHPGRTATAVVLTGRDEQDTVGVQVHLTEEGRLQIPSVGLDLAVVGLTAAEAQGCADLLASADTLDDAPIPPDSHPSAHQDWRVWADAAGALRTEHTLPRATQHQQDGEPATTLLDGPDATYLTAAATTVEDLAVLAPRVPASVAHDIHRADPDLDADLDAWFSQDCDRPRLTLLGSVRARTRGDALAVVKRKAYYTELLAYLALRPAGATPLLDPAAAGGSGRARRRGHRAPHHEPPIQRSAGRPA